MAKEYSNLWFADKTFQDLSDRKDFEGKLTKFHLQRFCLNRATVNNTPWPRASNVRYPLSDMIIDQKKPFFAEVLYESETLPSFTALSKANMAYATGCGAYLDYIIKQKTDFEEEILYLSDNLLAKAECYCKITWDRKLQVPRFTQIDPLLIITPWTATKFQKVPRFVHVMQFHKDEFIRRFQNEKVKREELEDLYEYSQGTKGNHDSQDSEQREYDREGISKTANKGKAVVWELHYEGPEGEKRIRTLSPDQPEFDFNDDRSYPYFWKTKLIDDNGEETEEEQCEWMVEHCRREYIDKKLHSSRSVCEVVEEGEYSLTAMMRAKQNDMTLRNAGCYYAPDGLPGNTQNMPMIPGQILPFRVEMVNQGQTPISWDVEMNQTKQLWEQRMATPNFGINEGAGTDKRTAKEVSFIQGLTSINVKQETRSWKRFIRALCRQAWRRCVQFKPRSLTYFEGSELSQLPETALNDDYEINVNVSADGLNKEAVVRNAETNFRLSQGNPFATPGEAYKKLLEVMYPSEVNRFYTNPQQRAKSAQRKAFGDIADIISTGAPIDPEPSDDFYTQAVTAMQYLQSLQQKGQSINPQQLNLISRYIQLNRDALKNTNKEAYNKLNQDLNQLEIQSQQQAVLQQAQARMNGAIPQTNLNQSQPQQVFDSQPVGSNLPVGAP
jgi:hypothetical protein